jgi:putative hemolysin
MNSKLHTLGIVLILSALIISGCGTSTAQPTGVPTDTPTGGSTELANPASVYCQEHGYTVEIRTDADGGQYGVCIFDDGSECEEWAFFRGECGPSQATEEPAPTGDPAVEQPVVAWLGNVVSLPVGSQYDDYLVLSPEGAGEVGVSGADEAIEADIVSLRDKEEPGKYAHFWGTLTCGTDEHVVSDYGGCQLVATQVRYGATLADPSPVEGWEGTIVSNPPGSQFDDYLVLAGDFPVGFGIAGYGSDGPDPTLAAQLESLRDTGTPVRVWGQVIAGVPDAFGSQIQMTRIEIE